MKKEAKKRRQPVVIGQGGNHVPILEALHEAGAFPPGSVTEIQIHHDVGCCIFKGAACDCCPDIEVLLGLRSANEA